MMQLYWIEDDRNNALLFAGCNETEIAWVRRSNKGKWWHGTIWLPGCAPEKKYGPRDEQMADIEQQVRAWFAFANMDRPATELAP